MNKSRGGKAQWTYCVEVPGPLEGKSLLETHCSLKSPATAHRQPVCADAYLNIPHPKEKKKLSQTVSVQVGESGNQSEGEGERRRKKERFPYSAAVAMETRPDNTSSLCHSGMKDLERINPPHHHVKPHPRLISTPQWNGSQTNAEVYSEVYKVRCVSGTSDYTAPEFHRAGGFLGTLVVFKYLHLFLPP